MSQEITPELQDIICDSSCCVDQKFLHHVWFEDKDQNSAPRVSCFCTSYHIVPPVLFPLIMAVLHKISPAVTIAILILMAPVCLLRADIKNKGEDGFSKGIDLKVVHLLFAAAKIVHNSITAAHDELAYDAETMVAQAIVAKEKATKYVKHCTKIDTSGPSLLDFLTNGEKGASFETLVETGRLQKLSIHGAA
uniref:Uncharacterized protein n=1 Tax=Tanacetum cinerariifolium TaxID=118510 RepID=A0A699H4P2_TANCI|nr:hypothetical protein [Tanacetum cinerariifolium]